MDFCSKYGYDYGFEGSDSEEISDDEIKEEAQRSGGDAKKAIKKVRKADCNLIAVKFDELVSTFNMFAGEPIRCRACEAIMSAESKKNISEDGQTWRCEYCYESNDISGILADQVPSTNDVTFLIEPAPAVQNTADGANPAADVKSLNDNHLSYCIDVSGSMDTVIPARAEGQNAPATRMTRLGGVQAACLESIDSLKTQEPNKQVVLTTFSDVIKYYGDTSKGPNPVLQIGGGGGHRPYQQQNRRGPSLFQRVTNVFTNISQDQDEDQQANQAQPEISPDIMDNKEKMIALATNQDAAIKPISATHASLLNRIRGLRTEGSTALGPGLTFSIGLAGKKAGSQIILCTDGCANVGMGSIESGNTELAEKFYEDLADYAKSKGVVVNVISMEGTDCKLALLGKVADKTNGTMNIVNPLLLGEQFKSILQNRVVATSVKAKLVVNKYLYIRDEKLEEAELKAAEKDDEKAKEELNKQKKSVVEKEIGNACVDTEITFEYGVRKLSPEEKKAAPDLKLVPFQLQISYVAPDGTKAMRVYTKVLEFTKDRHQAEGNLHDRNLVWSNAAQKISNYALDSNMKAAKYKEKAQYKMAMGNNWHMPTAYAAQQHVILNARSSVRSSEMDDISSNLLHAAKKVSRNKMN